MKAMRARGFVAGARQHLNGPGAEAFSAAIEFKAPRGARAEVAAAIADARLGSSLVTPIRVEGIPNARAVATANPDTKGYVIVFADGRFLYHLAVFYPRDSTKPLPYQRVLAGAQALHGRIHSSR